MVFKIKPPFHNIYDHAWPIYIYSQPIRAQVYVTYLENCCDISACMGQTDSYLSGDAKPNHLTMVLIFLQVPFSCPRKSIYLPLKQYIQDKVLLKGHALLLVNINAQLSCALQSFIWLVLICSM